MISAIFITLGIICFIVFIILQYRARGINPFYYKTHEEQAKIDAAEIGGLFLILLGTLLFAIGVFI